MDQLGYGILLIGRDDRERQRVQWQRATAERRRAKWIGTRRWTLGGVRLGSQSACEAQSACEFAQLKSAPPRG